jgi:hypothetical protein
MKTITIELTNKNAKEIEKLLKDRYNPNYIIGLSSLAHMAILEIIEDQRVKNLFKETRGNRKCIKNK